MARTPREARTLGLWTATWLFGLLLAGLLWVGDLSVQWPALLVPVVWGLWALRPRGPRTTKAAGPPPDADYRTDTVERPALRPPDRRDGRW